MGRMFLYSTSKSISHICHANVKCLDITSVSTYFQLVYEAMYDVYMLDLLGILNAVLLVFIIQQIFLTFCEQKTFYAF